MSDQEYNLGNEVSALIRRKADLQENPQLTDEERIVLSLIVDSAIRTNIEDVIHQNGFDASINITRSTERNKRIEKAGEHIDAINEASELTRSAHQSEVATILLLAEHFKITRERLQELMAEMELVWASLTN